MFTSRVKVTTVVFVSLLLIASSLWLTSGDSPKAQAGEAKDSKIKDLLKEKLAILKEVASQRTRLYQLGETSLSKVYETNQAVRNAELDLCDTDKERVAVLEKMLAEAKDYEKNIIHGVKAGTLPTNAALRAKVSRLDVEIALERAKGK